MRIVMIGQKGMPALFGGIERHTEELAVRLAEHGHDVSVFCRSWYTPVAMHEYRGVRLVQAPTIYTKRLDAITHTFFSIIRAVQMKPDIVHIHGVGPSLLAGFAKLLMPKAKVVVTFHCIDRKHSKWGFFARLMLRIGEWTACTFADATITVSRSLQEYCLSAYDKETHHIPSGVEAPVEAHAKLLKPFGLEANTYVLFIGRLVSHKRVHDLIAAWKLLVAKRPELIANKKLVIVGDSAFTDEYLAELRTLAGQDASIVFTGYQTGETLAALYTHAIAMVNPSESEGLPIATLEAMSYGKPVIASDIPENMELVSTHGLPFPRRDVAALAERLTWVLAEPEAAMQVGRKARDFVLTEYHIDTMVRRIEDLYMATRSAN